MDSARQLRLGYFVDADSSIVSRWRILGSRCVRGRSFMEDLDLGGHGACALIDMPGGRIGVVNVHLSPYPYGEHLPIHAFPPQQQPLARTLHRA